MSQNRILWVDTVKALGMFFIVLGHFFPPYISAWIYTFNVPLFFFISGFLAKKEENWRVFWRKNFNGLIVPFLLLSTLINFPYIVSNVSDEHRLFSLFAGLLLGFHSIDGMNGCMNMWFVYCLLMVKIVFQCSVGRRITLLMLAVCIIGMVTYHFCGLKLKWAVSNLLYAYPYFVMGYWFKQKNFIKQITVNIGSWQWNTVTVAFVAATGVLALYNGIAYTYEGGVGKSLLVMIICSVVNILAIVRFAYIAQKNKSNYVCIISKGSILILAFHLILLYPMRNCVVHFLGETNVANIVAFALCSIFICMFFVPVIKFVHKYIPILMGRR